MPERPKVTIVSLIGRPYAGKDTQAARFQANYPGIGIAATGALFRDPDFLARAGFSTAEIDGINATMRAGKLVADEIPERLMHQAILESAQQGNAVIFLTGHPRTRHQARDLREWVRKQNEMGDVEMNPVYIHLMVGKKRANARREIRLEQLGREDDRSEDTANKRHRVFENEAWPVLRGLWARRLLGHEHISLVRAGQSEDKVYRRIQRIIAPYLPQEAKLQEA